MRKKFFPRRKNVCISRAKTLTNPVKRDIMKKSTDPCAGSAFRAVFRGVAHPVERLVWGRVTDSGVERKQKSRKPL